MFQAPLSAGHDGERQKRQPRILEDESCTSQQIRSRHLVPGMWGLTSISDTPNNSEGVGPRDDYLLDYQTAQTVPNEDYGPVLTLGRFSFVQIQVERNTCSPWPIPALTITGG